MLYSSHFPNQHSLTIYWLASLVFSFSAWQSQLFNFEHFKSPKYSIHLCSYRYYCHQNHITRMLDLPQVKIIKILQGLIGFRLLAFLKYFLPYLRTNTPNPLSDKKSGFWKKKSSTNKSSNLEVNSLPCKDSTPASTTESSYSRML